MTKTTWLSLAALPLAGAIFAGGCNCKSNGGGGPQPTGRCDIDLSAYKNGSGATAKKIDAAGDLLQGDSASGRVGDFLLKNDLIQVVVQGPDRHIQPNPFGGAIVDADIIRPAGEATSDQFGKVAPLYNFGRTLNISKVEVVSDGKDGAAIVAATGEDEVNDYLNFLSLVPLKLPVDPNAKLPMTGTTYYVLEKGKRNVHIVTAFCNSGTAELKLEYGDLIDSGGTVEFFNPAASTGGFGYGPMIPPTELPFMSYWGLKSAYAYVPKVAVGNNQVTVSGVTGTLLGSSMLGDWVGQTKPPKAALTVPAGGSASYERDFVVGKDLGEVTDTIYGMRGATVKISGKVTVGGQPQAGVRVSIVTTDTSPVPRHPIAIAATAADGSYALKVPAGPYEVAADWEFSARSPWKNVDASADATQDFDLAAAGSAHLTVKDLAGKPLPAKVVVYCDGACPVPRGKANTDGNMFRNSSYDPWGDDVQAVVFVDNNGVADVTLPAGSYHLVATHGPEWSVGFPNGAADGWPASRGPKLDVASGAAANADFVLAHVLDTTGWMSGDFHVHAVNSPDSPVANLDRVKTFMAEGVDVMVATDHDYVTDFTPYVAELDAATTGSNPKASDLLKTVVGVELTTFDYGHWNGFPLTAKTDDLIHGAYDWAGGTDVSRTPKQIDDALKALPGAASRVVQANHPRGSLGWFTHTRLDTASGATHACPQQFRMTPVSGCDPATGSTADTGIWDEGFTAMEIVNDFEEQRIHGRVNDWLTFLSRGFVITATAVSDTHQRVASAAGYGRTYVNVGVDKPADLDPAVLADATNKQKAVASLGAFVTAEATNDKGDKKGIGELIGLGTDGKVHLKYTVQAPAWLALSQMELHTYSATRVTKYEATGMGADDTGNVGWPGYDKNTVLATETADLAAAGVQVAKFQPSDLVDGAEGGAAHQRWMKTVTFDVSPTKDTWYVLVVRRPAAAMGDAIGPVAKDGNPVSIMAVANAILVDANGNGSYDPPEHRKRAHERDVPWKPMDRAPETSLDKFKAMLDALDAEK